MELVLPLEKMTTDDKLRTMEDIWADLCQVPQAIPSPAWHADVLHAREERIRQGVSRFGDWPEAKTRIRERLPFAVYYRVEDGIAGVRAVLDCRRDPERTKNRLT